MPSRVGVMPQPYQTSQRNMNQTGGGGSSNRQKGITMEDLKRQTAIRLAQEQQHHGRPNEDALNHQNRPSSDNMSQQNQGYPLSRYPQADSYRDYQYSSREVPPPGQTRQQPFQQPHQQHQSNQYHQNHQSQQIHQRSRNENYPNSQFHGSQQQHPSYESNPASSLHYRNQNVQTQEMVPSPRFNSYEQQPHYGQGPAPRGVEFSDQVSLNKLPHGLTVQELKEMTKARLQAEAAEKHEVDSFPEGAADRRVSPIEFDSSLHEGRERTFSRDSTARSQTLHVTGSDSTNSIPSLVQLNQTNQLKGRQPQASPLPARLQNLNQVNSNSSPSEPIANFGLPQLPQQTWDSRQQLKLDAIETASTNSYNNNSVVSENLGSESAFSSGIGTGMLSQSDNDYAFSRSSSYTSGQLISNDGKLIDGRSAPSSACASPASSGNIFFDAAVGSANRRRAVTMSPKPHSILEDRPHFDGHAEHLAIPNFNSSGRVSLAARARTSSSSSILTPNGSDVSLLGQPSALFGFDEGQNRPRTHSSTSLPPISNTADEFGIDRVLGQQLVSQGREGPAIAYSAGNGLAADTSLGDRSAVRAPPGFSGNPGFMTADPVPPNNINRNVYDSVDALAGEMGSILNLSVGGQNRERLNTYPQTSRSQTPEYISEEFFSKDANSLRF